MKNNNCNKNNEPEGKNFWVILGIAAAVCIAICVVGLVASYCFVRCQSGASKDLLEQRGLFGDSWGGVNTLISALAFAGVIATLYLQNSDLRLQRKEMKEQRKEFATENKTLKYQRFENLFYNMLNLHQKIIEGLKYSYVAKYESTIPSLPGGFQKNEEREVHQEVIGRDVFRFMFDENVFTTIIEGDICVIKGYKEFLQQAGLHSFNNTDIPTYFDHYFRHLFQIVKFVEDQGFPFEESYKYVSLLRGTLSRYEMVWIYYHALQPENRNYKKLIEKYSLLEGLRGNLLSLSVTVNNPYFGLYMIEEEVEKDGFSSKDFECYLTDNPEDYDRYYLSAFWNTDNLAEGKSHLDRWREYFEKTYSYLIQDVRSKICERG